MLDDSSELDAFRKKLAHHAFSISAELPWQPDRERAKRDQEVSRKTIQLAEKLGVPMVIDFSGCPGDSPSA